MREFIIPIAIGILATQAEAQTALLCSQPPTSVLEITKACVIDDARRLERSKESAESIATAAIVNCETMFSPARDYYRRCYDPDSYKKLVATADRILRQIAVTEVVNVRAK